MDILQHFAEQFASSHEMRLHSAKVWLVHHHRCNMKLAFLVFLSFLFHGQWLSLQYVQVA